MPTVKVKENEPFEMAPDEAPLAVKFLQTACVPQHWFHRNIACQTLAWQPASVILSSCSTNYQGSANLVAQVQRQG